MKDVTSPDLGIGFRQFGACARVGDFSSSAAREFYGDLIQVGSNPVKSEGELPALFSAQTRTQFSLHFGIDLGDPGENRLRSVGEHQRHGSPVARVLCPLYVSEVVKLLDDGTGGGAAHANALSD